MSPKLLSPSATIRVVPLILMALITAVIAGLLVGYLRHQRHVISQQQLGLERELSRLIEEARGYDTQIANLTSRTALQRRMDERFVKLEPIRANHIVRVQPLGGAPAEALVMTSPTGGIRPASNQRTR